MNSAGDRHILPVGDLVDHDVVRECWCQPRLAIPCECGTVNRWGLDDGKLSPPPGGCWKCDGGVVDVERDHETNCLVVHHAADGRE